MEDLFISPWQYSDLKNQPNLFKLFPIKPSHQGRIISKNKHVLTEKDQLLDTTPQNKKFLIRFSRNKGHSFTADNLHKSKSATFLKRSQIKLVSYPTNEKFKVRDLISRYSEKLQILPDYKPQTSQFQVIQTFVSADLKDFKIFKQRSPKNLNFIQQNLKMKRGEKFDSFRTDPFIKNIFKPEKHKKSQISSIENSQKKLSLGLDPIVFSQISHRKRDLDLDNQQKSYQRLQIRVQKLQNANVLKEKKKGCSTLKKKSKYLVNQLQKYNLFGFKKLKKHKSTLN